MNVLFSLVLKATGGRRSLLDEIHSKAEERDKMEKKYEEMDVTSKLI